jgi:hypothetical protein
MGGRGGSSKQERTATIAKSLRELAPNASEAQIQESARNMAALQDKIAADRRDPNSQYNQMVGMRKHEGKEVPNSASSLAKTTGLSNVRHEGSFQFSGTDSNGREYTIATSPRGLPGTDGLHSTIRINTIAPTSYFAAEDLARNSRK